MTTTYVAVSSASSGYWHLGSNTRGLRTYCGKLLPAVRIVNNDASMVSCKACRKTTDWKYAEIQIRKDALANAQPVRSGGAPPKKIYPKRIRNIIHTGGRPGSWIVAIDVTPEDCENIAGLFPADEDEQFRIELDSLAEELRARNAQ
jgi:hypothetical protein